MDESCFNRLLLCKYLYFCVEIGYCVAWLSNNMESISSDTIILYWNIIVWLFVCRRRFNCWSILLLFIKTWFGFFIQLIFSLRVKVCESLYGCGFMGVDKYDFCRVFVLLTTLHTFWFWFIIPHVFMFFSLLCFLILKRFQFLYIFWFICYLDISHLPTQYNRCIKEGHTVSSTITQCLPKYPCIYRFQNLILLVGSTREKIWVCSKNNHLAH